MSLSASLLCLSMVVYHEARSEPLLGQQAVAHVVLNRVYSGEFPRDVCDVVTQDEQFPFPWTAPVNKPAWERAVQIAGDALAGKSFDPTAGALHYTRHDVTVAWTAGMTGQVIGEHVFWKSSH